MAVDPRLLEKLEEKLNLSRSQLNRRITERANALVIPREQAAIALALESKVSVHRLATPEDLAAIRQAAAARAPETPTPGAMMPSPPAARKTRGKSVAPRPRVRRRGKKVLVVHGRDEQLRQAMFRFLRSIGLEPMEWAKAVKATGKASPYIGEVLDQAFKDAIAVVVMLTADDQARLKKGLARKSDPPDETRLRGQARPNVLFEAGMAFGSHPKSTVLVQIGDLRPFSDIGGRHVVHLRDHAESRRDLANRLEAAGCIVDVTGTDWLTEGKFGA